MNLCIIQPNKNAYSETFIRNHEKYLTGNKFILHGPWIPIFWGDRNIVDSYLYRNIFSIFYLYLTKLIPVGIYNRLPSQIKYNKNDIKFQEIALKYFLKKRKIDVILAEFGLKGVIVAKVCEDLNIPLVIHYHGGDLPDMPSMKPYEDIFVRSIDQVNKVIAVSENMKMRLKNFGYPENKICLIPYGVDTKLFSVVNPSVNPPVFVSVGRFVEKKAPYLLVLAFSYVVKKHPDCKLIMIGDGVLFDVTYNLIRALNLSDNIILSGTKTTEEINQLLNTARAFLLHSITPNNLDREGTPNVVLEATAKGLPVISTKHEGIKQAVVNEYTGYLVDELDIASMSEHISMLIENPALAQLLGKNGRDHVLKNYELMNQIGLLDNELENCVNKNRI